MIKKNIVENFGQDVLYCSVACYNDKIVKVCEYTKLSDKEIEERVKERYIQVYENSVEVVKKKRTAN